MILINMALLGLLYYNAVEANRERARELELLYDNRKFVGKLLAECQPVPKQPLPSH